ncbi:MAG: lytic transglycosylase domain-containing protein [Lentisphaeraceae bacterium]|nr:lytic transglycosylase domain-containing protein [Lentisphaeraceae bacterium]
MSRPRKIFICLFSLAITAAVTIPLHYYIQFKKREKLYDDLIVQTAQRHSVDPALVKAVIRRESKFVANIRGSHGEYGLMQVTPIAADDWMRINRSGKFSNYEQLMTPSINLEVGTWYLARAMRKWKDYKQQTVIALAQYNAGPGNVLKRKWAPSHKSGDALKLISFPSTKVYIKDILKYEQHYKGKGLGNDRS